MHKLRLNLKTLGLLVIICLVAFVGVISGNMFMNWENSSVNAENLYSQAPVIKTDFSKDNLFPDVKLIDFNGNQTSSNTFIDSAHTVIIFLTPGCEPCGKAMSFWKKYAEQIPDGFQIVGICQSDFDSGKSYITDHGFPFSVYFDTTYTFSTNFNVNQFPNVMGLFKGGKIAFLNRGIYSDFSPVNACELIMNQQL